MIAMSYFVYILKSQKDNSLYVGSSQYLKSRLKIHLSGSVKTTSNRLPTKNYLSDFLVYRQSKTLRSLYRKCPAPLLIGATQDTASRYFMKQNDFYKTAVQCLHCVARD